MSNSREVEFDGDVWFFSAADSRKVAEIKKRADVHLAYADPATFRFISISGTAELITGIAKREQLWIDDLSRWFPTWANR